MQDLFKTFRRLGEKPPQLSEEGERARKEIDDLINHVLDIVKESSDTSLLLAMALDIRTLSAYVQELHRRHPEDPVATKIFDMVRELAALGVQLSESDKFGGEEK